MPGSKRIVVGNSSCEQCAISHETPRPPCIDAFNDPGPLSSTCTWRSLLSKTGTGRVSRRKTTKIELFLNDSWTSRPAAIRCRNDAIVARPYTFNNFVSGRHRGRPRTPAKKEGDGMPAALVCEEPPVQVAGGIRRRTGDVRCRPLVGDADPDQRDNLRSVAVVGRFRLVTHRDDVHASMQIPRAGTGRQTERKRGEPPDVEKSERVIDTVQS